MYAYLKGTIAYKEPMLAVMDVGGVGYEVRVSLNTSAALEEGTACRLHTHLHVKEDSLTVYGFKEKEEKELFLLLVGISGIGPGTALSILSQLTASEFYAAVRQQQADVIQSVKGIGKKTAERVILELKDKIPQDAGLATPSAEPLSMNLSNLRKEALAALVVLGIPKPVADKNIKMILKQTQGNIQLEELIKLALKNK